MKKLLVVLALVSVFTVSVFAQETAPKSSSSVERDDSKWSDLSYKNVPVLKVLESSDGYVVIYQKDRIGVGNVVIPKAWAKGSPDNPRKLKIRNVRTAAESYMSIIKEGGEFKSVVLNVPRSKMNYIWGLVDRGVQLEGVDKETLEELDY